jgi:transposase
LIMTLTTASLNGRAHTGGVTDDDIDPAARPRRRSFTAEYKAEIIAEYDSHPKGSEERGAILRREGLYSSHISEWRKQADAGAREGLAAKSKKRRSTEEIELEKLRRRNERLEAELAKTKTALEITGKVHALLERLSESADTDPRSTR